MYVSKDPASRREVRALAHLLEEKLEERQARQEGICEVRRELHSQCFQEIIRQSAVTCMERGLLMLRMRDELRLSVQAGKVSHQRVRVRRETTSRLCLSTALRMDSGSHRYTTEKRMTCWRKSPSWNQKLGI